MKKVKLIIAIFAAAMLSACGSVRKETAPPFAITSAPETFAPPENNVPQREHEDMPEDTPWNSGANAIMETETGYYMNMNDVLSIRYIEKKNGVEIYLCPKPECLHDGNESCVATYKHLITSGGTIMYNGDLYFLAYENVHIDETVNYIAPIDDNKECSVALYRARPDGTALDRIAEVVSEKDLAKKKVSVGTGTFIIHKGYAYVPFVSMENSGLMRINITSGKREQIYYCRNSADDPVPNALKGCGDYIYFDISAAADNSCSKRGTYRYSLIDGKVSPVPSPDDGNAFFCKAVTKDRVYRTVLNDEDGGISEFLVEYDSETGAESGVKFPIESDLGSYNDFYRAAVFDGMMFIYYSDRLSVFDLSGGKLAEMKAPRNEEEDYDYTENPWYLYYNFGISDGRLYNVCFIPEKRMTDSEGRPKDDIAIVYCCPIADIIAGGGKWETAYRVKGYWAM